MKLFKFIPLLFFLIMLPTVNPLRSQEAGDPCINPNTTPAVSACLHQQYEKADRELNVMYKRLLAAVKDKGATERLRASQRAWLKYRDAQAAYEAFFYKGGTGQGAAHTQCLTRLTEARTKELQTIAEEWE